MIETDRLKLYPASREVMEELIDRQTAGIWRLKEFLRNAASLQMGVLAQRDHALSGLSDNFRFDRKNRLLFSYNPIFFYFPQGGLRASDAVPAACQQGAVMTEQPFPAGEDLLFPLRVELSHHDVIFF